MKLSLGFSKTFLVGSFQAFSHALFPNTYITSTSDIHKNIGKELQEAGCRNNKTFIDSRVSSNMSKDKENKQFSYGRFLEINKNVSKIDRIKAIMQFYKK
jgi:hypothetical protein